MQETRSVNRHPSRSPSRSPSLSPKSATLRAKVSNLEGDLEKNIGKSKESTSEKEILTGSIKEFISALNDKEKIKFVQLSPSAQLRILSEYAERKEAIKKGEHPAIAGVGSRIATRELASIELVECFSKDIEPMLDTMLENEKKQTTIGSVFKNIKTSIKNLFNKP